MIVVLVGHPPDQGISRGELRWRGDLGEWEFGCPFCGHLGGLDHDVTVHRDGSVTISPSVICGRAECGAHFVVERGAARRA